CCRKNASSAWKLIPGTGMWPPTRYTASIRKVKMTRFLRSAMLKMFLSDSNIESLDSRRGDDLGPATRPRDLLQGRFAKAVRLHDDRPGQLAVAEHLDAREQLLHQALLTRRSGVISPSRRLSAPRLTTAYSLRNRLEYAVVN